MRFIYNCVAHTLRPVALAIVLWRGLRNRAYWEGLDERLGFGPTPRAASGIRVWVHAVSLGEVTAAAPLIRALRADPRRIDIIVTTATPTGRARARALFGDSIDVRYLPYDTRGAMRRFLARIEPSLVIILETELWPNLFHECHRQRIPVVLANARLTQKSVSRYRRLGSLFRDLWSPDTLVAAQSAADAARFIDLGAARARTHVIGNIKFDVPLDADSLERGRLLRAHAWSERPVWVAGSTHAGEEEAVLTAHADLRASFEGALLLLVPRHPERFNAVAELLTQRGVRFERRSAHRPVRAETQVLLVDSVGELAMLYAAVDVAFVGGSLVPIGGHNLLEPAALGVAVLTGPSHSNSRDVAQLLINAGGAIEVADAAALAVALRALFGDSALRQRVGASARQVVEINRGSLARLLSLLPIPSAVR